AQTTIRVLGALDVAVLERALTEITRRHELLRTTYEEVDGRPWQVIRPAEPVQVPLLDLSGVPAGERERRREEAIRHELRRPISLFELPLARWSALRLAPDEYELVLVEHHVVHDGWSFAVLMRELDTLYNAYLRGEPSPLPELPVQYSDFAVWQRTALDSPAMKAQLGYWRERLAGAPEVLPLRADHPRPPVQTFNGDLLRLELPPALPEALRVFCQQEGVTLFNTLFAAFATLLYRHTGERDLCIGSAFAARGLRQLDDVIGMFVNAVVLRCDVSGEPSFRALVRQVRDITAEAAENQNYPFVKLVEALGVKRDPSRNPLIQAMFSFHDSAVLSPRLGEASCTIFERGNGSSKVDLDVVAIPHAGRHLGDASRGDGRISLIWEYNRDLFDRSPMERMSTQYMRLLEAAVASPGMAVSRLPLLSDTERQSLLVDFNAPARVPAPDALVHEQVLAQAVRTPEALAVCDETGSLTYAELVRRARLLAGRLRQQGAGTDTVVGVCLPRGADLVTAELGVLLAGAAFLPLDADHPAERLAFILADAGARQVVTHGALTGRLPATLEHVRIEDVHAPGTPGSSLPGDVRPGHLAYVMYTSGSTGRPKGVMVEHRALANLVAWQRGAFGLDAGTRATLLYSPAFDPSAAEIWPALTVGASLHVPGQDIRLSPERLQSWLLAEHITFTDLPTALAERLLALPWPETCVLRTMLAGGDRLHTRPAPGTPWRLFNQYGPTETTVTATSGLVEPVGHGEALPTIGQPISGTTAYVLDGELQPVPVGVGGELYIGGAGLARGYLGRPDLTADRFVPDPFSPRPGARLYRTGDLVRHLPDGTLEFLGRADAQVKIRGFRVEPAEIAALLRTHPGLSEAHVSARSDAGGEPRLVGYLVAKADMAVPTPAQLRQHLSHELPAYMIPSAYVVLPALPLTHSGKVDERALPEPVPVPRVAQVPLANELEHKLAGLWRETLRLEQVGAEDNFFDLGGHSLLLARVQHALKGLGHEVPMVKLFEFPTVRTLARYLQGEDGGAQEVAAAQAQRQEQQRSGRSRLQGRRGRLAADAMREDAE
ncbi:MAG TPA: amino acid adenylation domain-containing protein, partial [Archangium sp.]|nr:amino acid adenylation domain-containing protein [Archangium sp.]